MPNFDFSRVENVQYPEIHEHFDEHIDRLRQYAAEENYRAYMEELAEFVNCMIDYGDGLDGLIKGKSEAQVAMEMMLRNIGIEVTVIRTETEDVDPNTN